MTKGFDEKIKKLKALEMKIAALNEEKEDLRALIFAYFQKENLDQYKVDGVATISRVERKSIKFDMTLNEIVAKLEKQNLVKYLLKVPEQIIPAKTVLNKDFEKDIEDGRLSIEGVSVETKTSMMARFDK